MKSVLSIALALMASQYAVAQSQNHSIFFCNIAANIGGPAQFTINNDQNAQSRQLYYKECQTVNVPSSTATHSAIPISVNGDGQNASQNVNLSPINSYNIILAVPGENGNGIDIAFPTSQVQTQTLPQNQQAIFYGSYPIGNNDPIDFIVNGQLTIQNLEPYQTVPPQLQQPFQNGPSVDIKDSTTNQIIATGFKVPILPRTTQQSILFSQCGQQGNTNGRPLEVFYTFTEPGIDSESNGNSQSSGASQTQQQPPASSQSQSTGSNGAASGGAVVGGGSIQQGSAVGFTVPASPISSTGVLQQVQGQQGQQQQSSISSQQQASQNLEQQSSSGKQQSSAIQQSTGTQQQSFQIQTPNSSSGASTRQTTSGAIAAGGQQQSGNQQQSAQPSITGSPQLQSSASLQQQSNTGSNGNASGNQQNDGSSSNNGFGNGISPNENGSNGCQNGNAITVGNTVVCTSASNAFKTNVQIIVEISTILGAALFF